MDLGPVARPTGASPKPSRAGSDPDPGRPNTRAVWGVSRLVPLRKPRACRRRPAAWNDAGVGLVEQPEQGRSGSPAEPPASRLVPGPARRGPGAGPTRTRAGPTRTRPPVRSRTRADPPCTRAGPTRTGAGPTRTRTAVGRTPDRAGPPRARGRVAAYPGGAGPVRTGGRSCGTVREDGRGCRERHPWHPPDIREDFLRKAGSAAAASTAATAAAPAPTTARTGRRRPAAGRDCDGGEKFHCVVMSGGAGRGSRGFRHRAAQFEGVAAGPAAVLVARHVPRLAGCRRRSQSSGTRLSGGDGRDRKQTVHARARQADLSSGTFLSRS